MTRQRSRGQTIQYWKSTNQPNLWGDEIAVPSDGPYTATAWVIPQRSQRSEVPGQQEILILRIGVDYDLDVSLWSRIYWDGRYWDIAAPPARHQGPRHVRHQSIDIRERTVSDVTYG